MMRARSSTFVRALCRSVSGMALFVTLGCVSAPKKPVTLAPPVPKVPAPQTAALVSVDADAAGFTVAQQVTVADDVRADYDTAIRLLRAEQYEKGIALLVKVTEEAPAFTAAHID